MHEHTNGRVDVRGLSWYLVLAYGITWLMWTGLWLSGQGVTGPWFLPVTALAMFSPAVAALVVTRWISPVSNVARATGLQLRAPGTRWLPYYLFAFVATPVLVIGALFVGAALGVYDMDLASYSAFREALEATGAGSAALGQVPISFLVWTQIALLPVVGLINVPLTFGEEYGWRGYLLPALLPLGQWPALILHGVIWGLWHAPIILMGYNYPLHPLLGVLAMTVFTIIWGIIYGWTRLATGSIWPAVIIHAITNASAGTMLLLGRAGATIDTLQASLLGWSGWILPLTLIIILVLARQLPVRNSPDADNPISREQAAPASTEASELPG